MSDSVLVEEMRGVLDLVVERAAALRKVGVLVFQMRDCSFQLAELPPSDADAAPPSRELTDVEDKPPMKLIDVIPGFEWEPLTDEG